MKNITLTVLLLIVALGIFIIFSLTIIIKRQVYRRRLRLKSPYTPLGTGASKKVKNDIDDNLLATQKIRCEPRLLQQFYRENFDAFANSKETSFIFRLKAVDDFKQLEETLWSVDPRSRTRAENCSSGWDRLRVYRGKHRALASASNATVEAYVQLYTLARHEPGTFGTAEYNRFKLLQRELLEVASAYKRRSTGRSRGPSQPLSPSDLLIDIGDTSTVVDPGDGAAGGRRCSIESSCASSDDSQTALIDCQAFGTALGVPGGAGTSGGATPDQTSIGAAVGAGGSGSESVMIGTSSGVSGTTSVRYTPIRRRDDKGRANEGALC